MEKKIKRPKKVNKPTKEQKPFDVTSFVKLYSIVKSGHSEMLQNLPEKHIDMLLSHLGVMFTKFTSVRVKSDWLKSALDKIRLAVS